MRTVHLRDVSNMGSHLGTTSDSQPELKLRVLFPGLEFPAQMERKAFRDAFGLVDGDESVCLVDDVDHHWGAHGGNSVGAVVEPCRVKSWLAVLSDDIIVKGRECLEC